MPPKPAANSPEAQLAQLGQLFHAGRFADMERQARALLKLRPTQGVLWKALGVALACQGKDAVEALGRAAQVMPNDPESQFNYGVAALGKGLHTEAEAAYRRALALQPGHAQAWNNLGSVCKETGRTSDAIAAYTQAFTLIPGFAEAHYNLGLTLLETGRYLEAEQQLQQAIAANPGYATAHNNLGLVHMHFGRPQAALESYHAALTHNPQLTDAWVNLADLYRQARRYGDALAATRRALELAPHMAEAHVAHANALNEIGELKQAMQHFEQALARKPDLEEAHTNLLFAENYAEPDATGASTEGQDSPLILHRKRAERFGAIAASRAQPYTTWQAAPDPDRPLRVGFVSGDFSAHPVGYFVESAFRELAATGRIAIACYANQTKADEVTTRIRSHCSHWRNVAGMPDTALGALIHGDAIDILIDLAGHTAHNRLTTFAWKPAPVQASWLGYFSTTGVAAVDYLIADRWSLPESAAPGYTETIWHLPETRLCFTAPDVPVATAPPPALAAGHLTFGCFNNLAKMGPGVVALWSQILHAVPGSTLFLKSKQLGDPAITERVRAQYQAHGIAANRLRLEGASPREQYLAAHNQVDIMLDPFPYTGGTTTVEALWMGVPVLTLAGERFIGRQGVALLHNAGLEDWVAATPQDYLQQALSRASDLPALTTLRARLRSQVLASPLFDAERFAGNFAEALRGMWVRWCEGQAAGVALEPAA